MHPHEQLIHDFYQAFAKRDHEGMAACYHADVRFSDAAFGELDAAQVKAMWRMLCERADDLVLEHSAVSADDSQGKAHWDARYTFKATGNKVHNRIDATFHFRDGKIVEHRDVFDFHAWSKQALGLAGVLLGWTSFLQNKVQKQARGQLQRFMEKRGL